MYVVQRRNMVSSKVQASFKQREVQAMKDQDPKYPESYETRKRKNAEVEPSPTLSPHSDPNAGRTSAPCDVQL
jgi:cell division septation protein DedD